MRPFCSPSWAEVVAAETYKPDRCGADGHSGGLRSTECQVQGTTMRVQGPQTKRLDRSHMSKCDKGRMNKPGMREGQRPWRGGRGCWCLRSSSDPTGWEEMTVSLILTRGYVLLALERKEGRETERNIHRSVASHTRPTGDRTHSLLVCRLVLPPTEPLGQGPGLRGYHGGRGSTDVKANKHCLMATRRPKIFL